MYRLGPALLRPAGRSRSSRCRNATARLHLRRTVRTMSVLVRLHSSCLWWPTADRKQSSDGGRWYYTKPRCVAARSGQPTSSSEASGASRWASEVAASVRASAARRSFGPHRPAISAHPAAVRLCSDRHSTVRMQASASGEGSPRQRQVTLFTTCLRSTSDRYPCHRAILRRVGSRVSGSANGGMT